MPNAAGTLALYTVSTYSFESHSETVEIKIFDLQTGESTLFTNDTSIEEPSWLGSNDLIVALKSHDDGTRELIIGDGEDVKKE